MACKLTNVLNEKEKIGHLIRFGLSLRKIELGEIIKWADFQIEKGKNDNLYLGLSFAKSTNEVIELLNKEIKWNFKSPEINGLILSYYNESLKCNRSNWGKIQKELMDFYKYFEFEDGNEVVEHFIYFLFDDYHLRNEGFEATLKMPDFLTENLSKFDKYQELLELLNRNNINGFEIEKTTHPRWP